MKTKNNSILVIGQEIYAHLNQRGTGYITFIHGEQDPASCANVCGVISHGGRPEFDIVFEDGSYSSRLPESILRGVQWDILENVVSSDRLAELLEANQKKTAADTLKRKQDAAAWAAEVERVKTAPEYAHLKHGENQYSAKSAAANLRADLKKHFPGCKFSVRKSSHNAVNVSWTDGPTEKEVKAYSDKYEGGGFDGMTDCSYWDGSPFIDVFGGCQYLFTNRDESDEFIADSLAYVGEKYNWEKKEDLTVEAFKSGSLYHRPLDEEKNNHEHHWNVQAEARRWMAEQSRYVAPAPKGGAKRTAPAPAKEEGPKVVTLKCCCCGERTKGRQWHNLEPGLGVCPKCVTFMEEHGEDVASLCGVAGINHSIQDTQESPTKADGETLPAADTPALKMTATTHTTKGHNIWVVSLVERVARDKYMELLSHAKELGGYYSRYSKGGAIPGFIFKHAQKAGDFMRCANV